MSDDPHYQYTFTTTITEPSGVRICVTTTVPSERVGAMDPSLASDLAEVTQRGATVSARHLADAYKSYFERCPF